MSPVLIAVPLAYAQTSSDGSGSAYVADVVVGESVPVGVDDGGGLYPDGPVSWPIGSNGFAAQSGTSVAGSTFGVACNAATVESPEATVFWTEEPSLYSTTYWRCSYRLPVGENPVALEWRAQLDYADSTAAGSSGSWQSLTRSALSTFTLLDDNGNDPGVDFDTSTFNSDVIESCDASFCVGHFSHVSHGHALYIGSSHPNYGCDAAIVGTRPYRYPQFDDPPCNYIHNDSDEQFIRKPVLWTGLNSSNYGEVKHDVFLDAVYVYESSDVVSGSSSLAFPYPGGAVPVPGVCALLGPWTITDAGGAVVLESGTSTDSMLDNSPGGVLGESGFTLSLSMYIGEAPSATDPSWRYSWGAAETELSSIPGWLGTGIQDISFVFDAPPSATWRDFTFGPVCASINGGAWSQFSLALGADPIVLPTPTPGPTSTPAPSTPTPSPSSTPAPTPTPAGGGGTATPTPGGGGGGTPTPTPDGSGGDGGGATPTPGSGTPGATATPGGGDSGSGGGTNSAGCDASVLDVVGQGQCLAEWALVPSDFDGRVGRMRADFDDSAFGSAADFVSVPFRFTSELGNAGGDCSGPSFDFAPTGNTGLKPLDSCDEPVKTIREFTFVFLSLLVWLLAAFACARVILSPFGHDLEVGGI